MMFTIEESPGRRKLWGVTYFLVALAGVSLLVPPFTPALVMQSVLLHVCGAVTAIFFGTAAVASFAPDRKLYWLENAASWFGNVGLVFFLFALAQGVLTGKSLNDLAEFFVLLAISVTLVGRAWLLQRYLRKQQRVRDVVRIAIKNEP